ncbi:hypothetical protein GCM10011490_02970 [Pseudoclavibacter endophyticus]|uniref:Alpha/beta fold hydrolase n=1 Tax=Pseudoclavibacter endophyticus TaxID=1778590 RepID=A0A6H9WLZ3_9MICO|nr:alpha/beta fold hydrolase [Pseudoclavibacter endophyticus]KAB1650173.1 alpha/beta fold hydrolase [Pseudoclavibacter endophyticus]GGA56535.1 hypothetical protein GCM10011490_02970 [Pseudoclavibacter endophyticus]
MRIHSPTDERLARMRVADAAAQVAGSRTRYWSYEAGPDDATTTIVLVHGFRGTHHGLLPVVAQFAPDSPHAAGDRNQSIRFIAPDLPGFGESDPLPAGHSLDDYAAWLAAFLEHVDPAGSAVVLGHSFGSLIVARDVRMLAPRRILLVNPIAAPALEGTAAVGTRLAILYYWLGAALPVGLGNALLRNRLITRVMSEVMAVTRSRALRAWIHREHDRHFSSFHDRDTLLEAFRASVSDSVLAHAAQLPAGTSLIAGARDAIAPIEAQLALAEAAPQASLRVIDGVGHLVHYETPAAAARLIRAAIDEWGAHANSTASTGESPR